MNQENSSTNVESLAALLHDASNKLVVVQGFIEVLELRFQSNQLTDDWLETTVVRMKEASLELNDILRTLRTNIKHP